MQKPISRTKTGCLLLFVLVLLTPFRAFAQADNKDAKPEAETFFDELKAMAEKGDAEAQGFLGASYALGDGVAKDYAEAAKWYRKAAEQGHAKAQYDLGFSYFCGEGVSKDDAEAVKWYRKAAEQGHAKAQLKLSSCYHHGNGVAKDDAEAGKWLRKAAEQGYVDAQVLLGLGYALGKRVPKDYVEAAKWLRKAAEQGYADAQSSLGGAYDLGRGVPKDQVEAHKWYNLAGAQGDEGARKDLSRLESEMTREQIADAERLAREFKPRTAPQPRSAHTPGSIAESAPSAGGSGFFITEDGYFVTNEHVVKGGFAFRLVTSGGIISAKVVKVDAANDLALLKAEGQFAPLPVASSRTVRLGNTVATVGFPNVGLQGFAPKLAKGEIAALSGAADDPRYFQVSVAVQPGNSGGALVDERGNVVGVVSAKLSARAALATSGALPENVNYAVKSSFLLSFLESVPDVAAKLKDPNSKERKFEDVVKSGQDAAALVLVY